jgi:hypothetical protein
VQRHRQGIFCLLVHSQGEVVMVHRDAGVARVQRCQMGYCGHGFMLLWIDAGSNELNLTLLKQHLIL